MSWAAGDNWVSGTTSVGAHIWVSGMTQDCVSSGSGGMTMVRGILIPMFFLGVSTTVFSVRGVGGPNSLLMSFSGISLLGVSGTIVLGMSFSGVSATKALLGAAFLGVRITLLFFGRILNTGDAGKVFSGVSASDGTSCGRKESC